MKNSLKKMLKGVLIFGILNCSNKALLADGGGSSGGGWPIYARTLFEEIKFNLAMDIMSFDYQTWLNTITSYEKSDLIFNARQEKKTTSDEAQNDQFRRLVINPSSLAGLIYNMKILNNHEFQTNLDNGHEFYFRISNKEEGYSRIYCHTKSCTDTGSGMWGAMGEHPINLGITTEKRAYSPFYNSLKSADVDKKVKKLLRIKFLHEVAHLWGADDERAEQFAEFIHSRLDYSDAKKVKCVEKNNGKICTGGYASYQRNKMYDKGAYFYKVLEIYDNGTAVLEEPYSNNIRSFKEIRQAIAIVPSNGLQSGSDCLNLKHLENSDYFPFGKICKNQNLGQAAATILLNGPARCSINLKASYGPSSDGSELSKLHGFQIISGAILSNIFTAKSGTYALEFGQFHMGIKIKDANNKEILGYLSCSKDLWRGDYLNRPFSYLFGKRAEAENDEAK